MLKENRCKWCNKLLFKGVFKSIQIKCPRCREINVLRTPGASHGESKWEKKTNPEF
ncbi:Com family DNA-binding transcriptional regulator [Pantoea agglomerans]|uniref:Com family DNA-binding transcriptional regulator n=1 Tax=Enterobacter agglomerans TaxID=549 RepID=UPI001F14E0A5|nr:Com family DNA-binding transcriptional regulator [Pantoea agglomerans]